MDCQRIYDALMARAVQLRGRPGSLNSRKPDPSYVKHHVIPASFFPGSRANPAANLPDNLVYLTNREHFLAHWLLSRIHGGRMSLAFGRMCQCSPLKYVSSRVYDRHYRKGLAARNADPDWQRKHRRNLKALAQNPEWKERMAQKNRRLAADPEWLARNREQNQRTAQTPEWKAKQMATAKRRTKPVIGVPVNGGLPILLRGQAAVEAAGFSQGGVAACCAKPDTSHLGYRWHYATPEEIKNGAFGDPAPVKRGRKTYIGTPLAGGDEIRFVGAKELTAAGFDQPNVSACIYGRISHHKGYSWRFAETTN